MKLYYLWDDGSWEYEIDESQMEKFFIEWNLKNFIEEKKKKSITLTKEERKLARELLASVAKNNDGYVEQLCKDLEDEVKEYFVEEAQEDMEEYKRGLWI